MGAEWKIRNHIKSGDIGRLTALHGALYSKEYGFDETFEAYVARGLAEFAHSFRADRDRIWLAETRGRIIGSIAIVGHPRGDAQLRWYLVHPDNRGRGLGERLLKGALRFCKGHGYRTVFLWTTSELTDAGRLYARFGFIKTGEKTHRIWGKRVTEERYDLRL